MNTNHSSRKTLSLAAFLILLVATTAQAKRVVERPYFMGSNNHKLEIERVTLDKKATILDVRIYQASGEVGIDSHASLTANGANSDINLNTIQRLMFLWTIGSRHNVCLSTTILSVPTASAMLVPMLYCQL